VWETEKRLVAAVLDSGPSDALASVAEVLEGSTGCRVMAAWRRGPPTQAVPRKRADRMSIEVRDPVGLPIADLRVIPRDPVVDRDRVGSLLTALTPTVRTLLAHASADASTRRSEEGFRSLVESSAEAVVAVSPDGTICYVNRAAVRVFGWEVEEFIGLPATRLLPEPLSRLDPALAPALMRREARRLDGRPTDLLGCRKNGEQVPLEVTLSVQEDEDGRRYTASIRDVTERAQAEAAIERALRLERRAAKRLRSIDRMRQSLVRAVYHELVEPLCAVRSLAQAISTHSEWPLDERFRPVLVRLHEASEEMSQLISDLLDVERFERGEVSLALKEVDLADLVREVLSERAVTHERVDLEAGSVTGWVDPGLVRAIVRNLIKNAVGYSPPGSRIAVTVAEDDGAGVISVSDNGPGIPKRLRRRVFQPFWRGSDRQEPGLGLGLNIVGAFAKAHGGRAWVEDASDGGARFSVALPLATAGRSGGTRS